MFNIRFETSKYRPDLRVTLRTDVAGWETDIPGTYRDDQWVFQADEADYPNGLHFKFVLEGSRWMLGDNLFIVPIAGGDFVFDETQVRFPPHDELVVEAGRVQQLFFPPLISEDETHDVIVVGSGIGGGIVADQMSDLGLKVLVLEAGSYLFPTHVGNLPRQHRVGRFDKHIWGLYDEFKVVNYQNAAGSAFAGGQAFNLGGRSLFWGGFIPRMSWWELDEWPQELRWYLEGFGYDRAENLMNAARPARSTYGDEAKTRLNGELGMFSHLDAPMAVQHAGAAPAMIPGGMFSTADLMLESILTAGRAGNDRLRVNLNHVVSRVVTDGVRAVGVEAHDLVADKMRLFRSDAVILSAGTVESAKVALMSGLKDPNGMIGSGITDHLIRYLHFSIPPRSRWYSAGESAKILSQHRDAHKDAHAYNLLLELGADLNQGRFVDDDILAEHLRVRGDTMLCELVFLFDERLVGSNRLTHAGPAAVRPVVDVQRGAEAGRFRAETDAVAEQLLGIFDAEPLEGEDLRLIDAELGGVAHEVGTLRLSADASGVVDENLRFLDYENLYACDLSVFPSSPAANPTLTLAALAIRLADHLHGQVVPR